MHRPVSLKEIQSIINIFQNRKPQAQMGSALNCIKYLRKFLPILYCLFQTTESDGLLPTLPYEASITLIPNPDKNIARKEKYRATSIKNIGAKILNKILATELNIYKVGFILEIFNILLIKYLALSLLGIYPNEMKKYVYAKTCI